MIPLHSKGKCRFLSYQEATAILREAIVTLRENCYFKTVFLYLKIFSLYSKMVSPCSKRPIPRVQSDLSCLGRHAPDTLDSFAHSSDGLGEVSLSDGGVARLWSRWLLLLGRFNQLLRMRKPR